MWIPSLRFIKYTFILLLLAWNVTNALAQDRYLFYGKSGLERQIIQNATSGNFSKAMEGLSQNCPTCISDTLADTITFGSERQFSEIYNQVEKKDRKCQENVLNLLANSLIDTRVPRSCLGGNQQEARCRSILRDLNAARGRVLKMVELVHDREEEEGVAATEFLGACPNYTTVNESLSGLFRLLQHIRNKNSCVDIQAGEEKTIAPGTGLSVKRPPLYTVRRKSNGDYLIPLTLRFRPNRRYDNDDEVAKDKVPEYYLGFIRDCLDQAKDKMFGPNGEKIEILVNSPSESSCDHGTEVHRITIGSKNYRSTLLIILHILHVMRPLMKSFIF